MYHVLRRIAAFAIDLGLLAVYASILFLFVSPFVRPLFATSPVTAELTGFLLLTLPFVLSFALCEASLWSATVGKRMLKLRVVQIKDQERLSFPRSIARSVLKFLPWELAHFAIWNVFIFSSDFSGVAVAALALCYLLLLVYLVGLLIKPHRPLYDRIAGTVVQSQPRK